MRSKALPIVALAFFVFVGPAVATGSASAQHAGHAHGGPEHGAHAHGDHAHSGHAHGDHAHGVDAHGDDAHGGSGHSAHHIDNWFSCTDYGPGKKYANPPLAFALFNFALLIFLLVKFTRKPFAEHLQARSDKVRNELAEATALKEKAQARLDEIEARLAGLDAEIERMKQAAADDAELEKKRIIATAEADAEHIVASADRTLDNEIKRIRHRLETKTVDEAIKAAEKILVTRINESDRRRLDDEYVQQLAESSGQ